MIVTPSIKTRLLKPFLIFAVMVGALICAPAAMADDTEDSSYAQAVVDNICTWYNLDREDVNYIYTYTYRQMDNRIIVAVYPSDMQPQFRYGSNVYGSSETLAMNFQFVNGYTWIDNDTDFGQYSDNGTSQIVGNLNGYSSYDLPHQFYGSFSSVSFAPYQNTQNLTEQEAVSYNVVLPPVETDSQTYANAMLQQYLHQEGFAPDMSTAWLIAPSGQPTQIPMSYTTPSNYNGDIWVQVQNVSPYLDKFTPRFSDNFNAADFVDYKLAVSYDIDVSYVKLYALTDKQFAENLPFNIYINDTIRQDSSSTLPQTKCYYDFDGLTYYGSLYEQDNGSTNDRELLYCIWDFNPFAVAAIPRFASLYCALDVRTVDSNGNTVISRDSNDYRQFVTNYNQKAVSGLTGVYTGSTFSKQDWRGQSVSQDVDYRNDFTITYDSNLGQVFRTIFSMGNGYILTLCIGGLSIAFAAYVLFGKH